MTEQVIEYVDEPPKGNEQIPLNMMGQAQNAEFLKYLLDTSDPIAELQNELEGREVVIIKDRPKLQQVRAPLVNPTLRNKIVSMLKTYNNKTFITTSMREKDIKVMVAEVAHSIINDIELSRRYSSIDWKTNKNFQASYPAFMQGTQDQIVLLIEHTVQTALQRSVDGLTLNKVTGVHSSQEVRTDAEQKKQGILGGVFR